jgi:hypothetical protein
MMKDALERDKTDLYARLDGILARDDQSAIIEALREPEARLKEIALAFAKVCSKLESHQNALLNNVQKSQQLNPLSQDSRDAFILGGEKALRNCVGDPGPLEPWNLTSMEVIFDMNMRIGGGRFGITYKGDWNGQV